MTWALCESCPIDWGSEGAGRESEAAVGESGFARLPRSQGVGWRAFTGASIFGATFISESAESAVMDETTRIPRELLEALTDDQHEAVLSRLGY